MSGRVFTQAFFDALLQAFRDAPGNISHAARQAGCSRQCARRAWEKGYAGFFNGKSLKALLEDDQLKARAAILQEQMAARQAADQERDLARKQAAEARKIEGQMIAAVRVGLASDIAAFNRLAPTFRKAAEALVTKLEAEIASNKTGTSAELLALLHKAQDLRLKLNQSTMTVMQLERLYLGEPGMILGHKAVGDDPMSLEEADLRIKAAQQALESTKSKLGLHVVPGGKLAEKSDAKLGT